jgi:hypothetical protein
MNLYRLSYINMSSTNFCIIYATPFHLSPVTVDKLSASISHSWEYKNIYIEERAKNALLSCGGDTCWQQIRPKAANFLKILRSVLACTLKSPEIIFKNRSYLSCRINNLERQNDGK